ncbi:hypothetical protein [Ruminiclostridium josui]|uniref:hypothetical protein n=1 Tax=Ruminiclostridium josui TaxID=1499 RepID=UPI0006CFA9EB|nr:hypothetical protein [Ruminiclostridium josui]
MKINRIIIFAVVISLALCGCGVNKHTSQSTNDIKENTDNSEQYMKDAEKKIPDKINLPYEIRRSLSFVNKKIRYNIYMVILTLYDLPMIIHMKLGIWMMKVNCLFL